MSLTDILFNAASGGVFGSILHLGTSFFDTWKKKKEAETEIMLMKAKADMAEKAAAWDAFARSQPGTSAPFVVPANAAPWAGTLATVVEAFKTFTRPGLTWALLLVLVLVYFTATAEVRATMTGEITFGAFTALFWWFGSRYTQKGAAR
jgi:hypothetical protein